MIALAAAIKDYWHAVERDLSTMGLDADDIGTSKLPLTKLISIVIAAPPGTACHHWNPNAWSRTDELIATLTEQNAGVVSLTGRYPRPEVDSTPLRPNTELTRAEPYRGIVLDAFTNDGTADSEFTVKLKERQRKAREEASTS